jgi:hypothetical protein
MGAAKFPEEIVERYVESYDALQAPLIEDGALALTVKPKLIYCPLCEVGFLEESVLDRHIAGAHGKQHAYLKVNDQIVRDVCWTKNPIKKCELVILKIDSVEVGIQVEGHSARFQLSKTASLLDRLPVSPVEGMIKIEVRSSPFSRSFTLYQGRQPTFRSDRLDSMLRQLMENPIEIGKADLIGIRDRCQKLGLNDLEDRYLKGVLEYCHGTSLEIEGKIGPARDRLESAMDLLIPFATPIAEQVRPALTLRMNCFAGQWGCSSDSCFRIAETFFCTDSQSDPTPESTASASEPSIWLDPISAQILEALRAFEANNCGKVFSILKSITVRDRNDEDKTILIEARAEARTGNVRRALAVYEKFVDHPIFGKEAEQYKRQHSA